MIFGIFVNNNNFSKIYKDAIKSMVIYIVDLNLSSYSKGKLSMGSL